MGTGYYQTVMRAVGIFATDKDNTEAMTQLTQALVKANVGIEMGASPQRHAAYIILATGFGETSYGGYDYVALAKRPEVAEAIKPIRAHVKNALRKVINKKALVALVSSECEVSKAMAEKVISATLGHIRDSVANGKIVSLYGFGSFKTALQGARTIRNPQTGMPLKIPAKQIPKFAPSENFKFGVLHKSRGLAYYAELETNFPPK